MLKAFWCWLRGRHNRAVEVAPYGEEHESRRRDVYQFSCSNCGR